MTSYDASSPVTVTFGEAEIRRPRTGARDKTRDSKDDSLSSLFQVTLILGMGFIVGD